MIMANRNELQPITSFKMYYMYYTLLTILDNMRYVICEKNWLRDGDKIQNKYFLLKTEIYKSDICIFSCTA